jgi:hypothetical protein
LEVVLEDQILYADAVEEVASEESPHMKLHKKEQRLLERLQEEQEAEAEAQDRFKRAKARLQRKRKRVERIQRKLTLVQEELAMLQITDQHPLFKESEVILVPLPEEVLEIASEEGSSTQSEQQDMIIQETVEHSQAYTEYSGTGTGGQEQEYTFPQLDVSDVPAYDGDQVMAYEEEMPLSQEETLSPLHFTYEPLEPLVEPEFEAFPEDRIDEEHITQQEINALATLLSELSESSLETEVSTSFEGDDDTSNIITSEHEIAEVLETSSPSSMENIAANDLEHESAMATGSNEIEYEAEASESDGLSSEPNVERRPTKPLQVEQPGSPVTVSHDALVQSAKEAWIAAESAMQRARNSANGINASNAILTQTEGLSKEFMEELASKQAEANRELLQAQDIARAAYERFVQVQKDTQPTSSESPIALNGPSQQNQDDNPLPPAEENGLDQTAKLQVAHLYTEW